MKLDFVVEIYEALRYHIDFNEQKEAATRFDQAMIMRNSEIRKLQKAGDTEGVARIRQEEAAKAGYKLPEQATGKPAPAQTTGPKDLNAFLIAARKANPGVSDADLKAYYDSTYGK